MNIQVKSIVRTSLILGSIVVINLNSDFDDILLTILMLAGVIIDFIKIEKSVKESISILLFWFIFMVVIFFWKNVYFFNNGLFLTELVKILIMGFISYRFEKNEMQNSIISKLWIVAFFLLLSEIALNSTLGFQSIYLITLMFSLTYSILKSYKLQN